TPSLFPLSLHDALPISDFCGTRVSTPIRLPASGGPDNARLPVDEAGQGRGSAQPHQVSWLPCFTSSICREIGRRSTRRAQSRVRSEEHTSELQSPCNLV